jgi:hypothetical protein
LAIYTPSDFILASRREKYMDIDSEGGYSGLTMSGREKGIRRLMSINLLKRLESSVNSFRLTLQRIQGLITSTMDKLNPGNACQNIEVEDIHTTLDSDDQEADMFIGGKKTKIALQDLDHIAWRRYLSEDLENLNLLLLMLADITPQHDSKLQQLIADLRHKFANPINEGNKKVIIFTAFSDTAEYLYDCLAQPIKEKHGLNTALVSGDVEARSTVRLPQREKLDFNKVLTLFSPISVTPASMAMLISSGVRVLLTATRRTSSSCLPAPSAAALILSCTFVRLLLMSSISSVLLHNIRVRRAGRPSRRQRRSLRVLQMQGGRGRRPLLRVVRQEPVHLRALPSRHGCR